jgi:hypothetical protein
MHLKIGLYDSLFCSSTDFRFWVLFQSRGYSKFFLFITLIYWSYYLVYESQEYTELKLHVKAGSSELYAGDHKLNLLFIFSDIDGKKRYTVSYLGNINGDKIEEKNE